MSERAMAVEVIPPPSSGSLVAADRGELTVQELVAQVAKIQEVMAAVMRNEEHYGTIPGTPKPTLYKAGAEKLCLLFRLDPQYDSVESWDGKHLTIKSKCTLYHIASGERRGSGEGSCSTKESKYAYRNASRKCPACGKEAIIKGKEEYGGGWVCFKKKDGCGAKYKDDDKKITAQEAGRVANEDLADAYNTVLKMANKRSLIAAVLNVTAASDIFTQDVEDLPRPEPEPKPNPHSFRPSEEELARMKAEAEPEPPIPVKDKTDLKQGFEGDDEPGPVFSKADVNEFWKRCAKRSEQTKLTRQAIGNAILEGLGHARVDVIPKAEKEFIWRAIEQYKNADEPEA